MHATAGSMPVPPRLNSTPLPNPWLSLLRSRRVQLLLLLGIVFVGARLREGIRQHRFQAAVTALQQAGEPIWQADIAALQRLPEPGQYLHDFAIRHRLGWHDGPSVDSESFDGFRFLPGNRPLTPETRALLEAECRSNAPVIQAFLPTDLTRFRFANDFHQGFPQFDRQTGVSRGDSCVHRIAFAKALAQFGVQASLTHDESTAGNALLRAFQLARIPSLGLQRASGALFADNLTLQSLERVLNTTPLSEASLKQLGDAISTPAATLTDALLYERAEALGRVEQAGSVDRTDPTPALLRWTDTLASLFAGYDGRIETLTHGTRLVEASRRPLPERTTHLQQLTTPLPVSRIPFLGIPWCIFDRGYRTQPLVEGRVREAAPHFDTNQARRLAALVSLAIERWKLSHDGLAPDHLQQLVPVLLSALPIDPFTGEPFRFRVYPGGYRVYSVGPDGRDDHGLQMLLPHGGTPDIGFTIDAPPRRFPI